MKSFIKQIGNKETWIESKNGEFFYVEKHKVSCLSEAIESQKFTEMLNNIGKNK